MEALKKEWMEEMKAQMAGNEQEMAEMAKSYEQKLKEAQEKAKAAAAVGGADDLQRIMKAKKTTPHIYNINFDPQLSGRIVHILDKAETQVGNGKNKDEGEIVMIGPG